jgi:uncharacterized Zn-binding protein involved in type VI secretion
MNGAARITDLHQCPAADPKPHVGGPIVGPGAPTVLINNLPAALVGDQCICVGPPASILSGSATVLANDKPIARRGDRTAHGGAIAAGSPDVVAG